MSQSISVRPAEFIRLDLFPALITTQENDKERIVTDQARVIVTNDSYYFFLEGSEGPEIGFEGYISDFTGKNVTGYDIITEDTNFHVKRAPHCGCGSRLRGFFPFPGVPFLKIQ